MNNNSKNAGRKIGSNNLLSAKAKQKLFELFEKDFLNIHKLFQKANIDGRGFYHLKPYAKMLTTGPDKVSLELKSIIFKSLKPEFLRLNTYISQLSAPERVKQLRYYLQMLSKEQIEEIFGEMIERKEGIYKRKND